MLYLPSGSYLAWSIVLPSDSRQATAPSHERPSRFHRTDGGEVAIDQIPASALILDVGPQTVDYFTTVLKTCRTIIWNGPLGAFETLPFHKATFALAQVLAGSSALTVVGGGDSAAAVKKAGVADQVSYVSTGGGAFLEMMEGKTLPGIAALEQCSQRA